MRALLNKTLVICACAGLLTSPVNFYAAEESLAQQTSKDFTAVAKKAIPAVVSIKIKGQQKAASNDAQDSFNDEFLRRFFAIPRQQESEEQLIAGQASGFIVSPDGYILTNSHVVRDASNITVILNDGREFTAKVIGQDPNSDIAVIKIDASKLPYLQLGNSDDLEIGQWVTAIGNPFGLQASLTVGVVSAKGRNNLDLTNWEDFIQTDAAINRGNSGGPLLNLDSKVIGMNSAIVTNGGSGGYMGIGFAIPSNMLAHIKDQLIKTGTVTRGFIGVTLQSIDHDLAQAFGISEVSGAVVADVAKGSPADKAGVKQGDIIQFYNKSPVHNIASLRNAIAMMNPDARITLSILRNGKTMELPVQIGQYPTSAPQTVLVSGNKLGFTVQDLNPDLARTLGISDEKGVVISKVESNGAAAWAGLKPGAIIAAVNQQPIENVEQFNTALQGAPSNKPTLLLVKQGEITRYISIKAE